MDDARKDALDVLGDVAKWRLAADHWPPVASVLRELADAAATDDVKVLIRATAALEAICPHRISMIDSGVPVPRSLRLRLDTLVHALTGSPEQTGPMVGSRAGVRVPPPRLGPAVPRQELVLHAFVALDGPWAQPAYRELRAVWTRARRTLGATAALDGTAPPPTELPEDCALLTTGPLLAGRQRPDRTAQVVIRREHDVLVLSIGWRIEPGIARPAWPALRGQRTEILDGVTDGFLGAVEILTGTCEVTHQADVLSRLADGADDLWTGDGASHGGVTLWELPPSDDHARAWRQLLALAPVRDHAELSALLWSDRSPALPPLARYLLDAAKVRYELRIRLAASDPLRATVERGGEADLAVLASQLESMRRTVDIAASNMTAVVDVSAGQQYEIRALQEGPVLRAELGANHSRVVQVDGVHCGGEELEEHGSVAVGSADVCGLRDVPLRNLQALLQRRQQCVAAAAQQKLAICQQEKRFALRAHGLQVARQETPTRSTLGVGSRNGSSVRMPKSYPRSLCVRRRLCLYASCPETSTTPYFARSRIVPYSFTVVVSG